MQHHTQHTLDTKLSQQFHPGNFHTLHRIVWAAEGKTLETVDHRRMNKWYRLFVKDCKWKIPIFSAKEIFKEFF